MTNQDDLPSTPAKTRIYAVGDIHGRLDLLRALMSQIEDDAARNPNRSCEIIFLGDYVDRGTWSKGVIDFLLSEIPQKFNRTFLRGNHDDAFLRFIRGDMQLFSGWMLLGGTATLASYGVNPFRAPVPPEKLRADLLDKMPRDHIDFLENLEMDCHRGDYYFVHAGVRPGVALDRQSDEDRMWIRNEFLNSSQNFGAMVVHGHTVTPEPQTRPNRIGIDTGAYATSHLTALVLQDTTRGFMGT